MEWLLEPFRYEFMRWGILGAVIAALACGLVGVHLSLRGMAFLGDALAHAALPGIVLAQAIGFGLLGGAFASCLLTVVLVAWLGRHRYLSEDSVLGVAYTGMFACGILLLNRYGDRGDLAHLLLGNVLGITPSEVLTMLALLVVVSACLFAFHKELLATSIDPGYADRIGCRVDLMRGILLVLAAVTIVLGIRTAGVVLTSALLITPAACMRLLGGRLAIMQFGAAGLGAIASVLGMLLAFYFEFSGGAAIVVTLSIFFLIIRICIGLLRPQTARLAG